MSEQGETEKEQIEKSRSTKDFGEVTRIQFREVTKEAVPEVLSYFELRADETCDATFASTYLWKDYYHPKYAVIQGKGLLWYAIEDGRVFWSVPRCAPEHLSELFECMEKYNKEVLLQEQLRMEYVDERSLRLLALDPCKYEVTVPNPSLWDYVYDGDDLRKLPGRKYHKKKNHIRAFEKEYEGRWEYRSLSFPLEESEEQELWAFLSRWNANRGEELADSLMAEERGLSGLFEVGKEIGIRLGAIYVDGQMEACALGSFHEPLQMAIVHVEKANAAMRGLYGMINREFLCHEYPHARLVNREDDMGLAGLRKAKESYYPVKMAKKYVVIGKLPTRSLWETVFSEDSKEFLDYYYQEKCKDNRVLAQTSEQGEVVSMLHLNPFSVCVKGICVPTFYVVAVATKQEYRRQGLMKRLFENAFSIGKEECPFLFLTAVDENLYTGLGFVEVSKSRLPKSLGVWENIHDKALSPNDYEAAADYINQTLEKQYDVYIRRDKEYMRRLVAERSCEGGGVHIITQNENICGYYQWIPGEDGKPGMVEWAADTDTDPAAGIPDYPQYTEHIEVMVRITNVLWMLRLAVPRPVEAGNMWLSIEGDSRIMENNGCYLYDSERNLWKKCEDENLPVTKEDLWVKMDMEALTRWLFGCMEENEREQLLPKALEGIFIHELV